MLFFIFTFQNLRDSQRNLRVAKLSDELRFQSENVSAFDVRRRHQATQEFLFVLLH